MKFNIGCQEEGLWGTRVRGTGHLVDKEVSWWSSSVERWITLPLCRNRKLLVVWRMDLEPVNDGQLLDLRQLPGTVVNSHITLPRPPTTVLVEGTTHFSGSLKGGHRLSSSACTTGSTFTLGSCLGFCTSLTLLPPRGRWRQLLQRALTLRNTQLTSAHTETNSCTCLDLSLNTM